MLSSITSCALAPSRSRAAGLAFALFAASAVLAPAASAQTLYGLAYRGPTSTTNTFLYTVNPATGAASPLVQTNATVLLGLAFSPQGTVYTLTDQFSRIGGVRTRSFLATLNLDTGVVSPIGTAVGTAPGCGVQLSEGDLQFQPGTGTLYGVSSISGATSLLTFNTTTGAATVIASPAVVDASAMAFRADGALFLLDTSNIPGTLARLVRIDPATGATISAVNTNLALGTVAGMAFSPATGELLVADGDFAGTNNLMRLDVATGRFTVIGSTGLLTPNLGGLGGLAFAPPPPCVADLDNGSGTGTPDGGVGIEDLLYYLIQYDAGSLRADLDNGTGTGTPDGGVGIEDLLYYLQRYDAGC